MKAITSIAIVVPALILCLFSVPATAQWINYPSPGTPRTPDGKPNLKAPAPKAPDGKPDLSGIWHVDSTSINPILFGALFVSQGGPNRFSLQLWTPNGAPIPMQPWAEAVYKERQRNFSLDRPSGHCLPHGIPDAMVIDDFKIVQHPGLTLILYEEFARFRQIFTDGRSHPEDMNPAWLGYSIGKWDQDRFVVDTLGYNDLSWLDDAGHPHSDALHTIESFRRVDFGHMDFDLTIDDPKAYTRSWSIAIHFVLFPDTELIEDVCDNERDDRHLVGRAEGDNKPEVKVAPETLSKYIGAYEFTMGNATQVLEISLADGHLMFFGMELTAVSETEFAGVGGGLKFVQDGKGTVKQVTLSSTRGSITGVRKSDAAGAAQK
jgi:hypothetical protein